MKVLWLCSWYPNKIKNFDGDFIQRHARAVSHLHDVYTIFVKKDDDGQFTDNFRAESQSSPQLNEVIVYYKPDTFGINFIDKWISNRRYNSIFKHMVRDYIKKMGKPDIVHVHVTMKAGNIALWMKKKYGIPYIVTEHWTGFLPEAIPGLKEQGWLFKKMCSRILQNAAKVTAVSKVLADSMSKLFGIHNLTVIPNVVDTSVFFPAESKPAGNRFIHISTMTWQKNIEHILEACKILSATDKFSLLIFTPDQVKCHELVKHYQLEAFVEISAEVPQSVLASEVRNADALILYSRYETFGCVVIEANASGIPAILSDLPVFREYSLENKTAIFVPSEDPKRLAETMKNFLHTTDRIHKKEILEYISGRFNFDIVAKQFDQLYKSL